jgi:nitroimidazol reductase NimA-like FMN-containing flavoprotein (pyridoxamine 5'-phosphate oxidase superfamily)
VHGGLCTRRHADGAAHRLRPDGRCDIHSRLERQHHAGSGTRRPEICINLIHLDGLVLSRSLYNHSVNYRSVVVFGRAERVEDQKENLASFKAYADQVLKGRFEDVRPPNEKELNSTTVMRIPLAEAVCKLRAGPGQDFDHDLENPCWAGELLIKQSFHAAVRDPRGRQDVPIPDYITQYERLPNRGDQDNSVDVL